jgi:hypothetical protein
MGSKPTEVVGFLSAMKIQNIVSLRRKLNMGYHVIHLQHVKEFFTHKRQEKTKFDTIFGHPQSLLPYFWMLLWSHYHRDLWHTRMGIPWEVTQF